MKKKVLVRDVVFSGMFEGSLVLIGTRDSDGRTIRSSKVFNINYISDYDETHIETHTNLYITHGNIIPKHFGTDATLLMVDDEVIEMWAENMAKDLK